MTLAMGKRKRQPTRNHDSESKCCNVSRDHRHPLLPGATVDGEGPGNQLADKTVDDEHVQHDGDTVLIRSVRENALARAWLGVDRRLAANRIVLLRR
jgi:hypothetical protein